MNANTLFLRLEGPLQAWGSHEAKFAVRRVLPYPSKSGVIGLLCAVMGIDRQEAGKNWLARLNELQMGVRIDIPGVRWWDFQTVGADTSLRTSELN
ncbi:MAG TPA: type I-E CRISPR-associated protein Cas5/CasD, partial [Candidatus Cloacimonadota bacterium]|nr:type I-E CRISPR-associated protein Cas5/CasD [Candidatus Cloacimonadota bacterium]